MPAGSARTQSLPVPQPAVAGYYSGPAAGAAAPAPGPCFIPGLECFTPAGMQASFNLNPLYGKGLNGKGETIAIVDSFGYPTVAADLETFSSSYGLPMMCGMPGVTCTAGMPTFSVLQYGNHQVKAPPPTSNSSKQEASNAWSVEIALDTQWAHAIAPEANILLVTTPTAETLGVQGLPQMMDAEQYVVDNHLADVVSQSFGAAEQSFSGTASLLNLRHAFTSGTAAGITFVAASGDNGTANPKKPPVGQGGALIPYPTVGWPASDPLVVAAGGTTLCTDPTNPASLSTVTSDCSSNPGMQDVGWNGSGGGYSSIFAEPSWQQNLPAGSTPISGMRGVPDVSWDASCTSLVYVLDTAPGYNHWYGVCGTSAASPQLAAMISIADQKAGHDLGNVDPTLYQIASVPSEYAADFYDVTAGNNTQDGTGVAGYNASTGWDPVTGLGTPNAANLVPDLAAG